MGIKQALVAEIERLEEENKELKETRFVRFNDQECWVYQGDEDDKLESLVCPVIIDAQELLRLKKALETKVKNTNSSLCPTCGEPYVSSCRCPRGDKKCKNGHEWHTCTVHKTVVLGKSDHSKSSLNCSCGLRI